MHMHARRGDIAQALLTPEDRQEFDTALAKSGFCFATNTAQFMGIAFESRMCRKRNPPFCPWLLTRNAKCVALPLFLSHAKW